MNDQKKKGKILVVEDEKAIREGLVDLLLFHGYEVDWAIDGGEALEKGLTHNYDLCLLDVMLPKKNGFEVCQELRSAKSRLSIIMLTAKTTEEDIINGFSLGADDYIAKPFSLKELLFRIQALLRRTQIQSSQKLILEKRLEVDLGSFKGRDLSEKNLPLIEFTVKEIEVLNFLFQAGQKGVSREDLLVNVWGYRSGVEFDTRTVDIHIAKLRKKIESNPKEPRFLKTLRGVGYYLEKAELK